MEKSGCWNHDLIVSGQPLTTASDAIYNKVTKTRILRGAWTTTRHFTVSPAFLPVDSKQTDTDRNVRVTFLPAYRDA
jgi:hypothetical protein